MSRQKEIQELRRLEAISDYLKDEAIRFSNACHRARQKLEEGVSTPSNTRKGQMDPVLQKLIAKKIARRNARIISKQPVVFSNPEYH